MAIWESLLSGMQLGYTKICCFLCTWDNGDMKSHYIRADWVVKKFNSAEKNVVAEPLVDPKMFFSHPYISSWVYRRILSRHEPRRPGFLIIENKISYINFNSCKSQRRHIFSIHTSSTRKVLLLFLNKNNWKYFTCFLKHFSVLNNFTNRLYMASERLIFWMNTHHFNS